MDTTGTNDSQGVFTLEEVERLTPNKTSLPASLAFISSALQRLGITERLNLMSNDPQDVLDACNAIYSLLLQHEKDVEYKGHLRQEVQDARRRLQVEQRERAKLESQLENKERDVFKMSQNARNRDETHKEDAAKARRDAEDLNKRLLANERRVVQMRHEIKRKEKEYEKLQQKLSKYLTENGKTEKTALDIVGQLSRGLRNQNVSPQRPPRQDEGLKTIVSAYETKQQEYKKEIEGLKKALNALQEEHTRALNRVDEKRKSKVEVNRLVDDSFIQGKSTRNISLCFL